MKQGLWNAIFLVNVFLGMCLLKADGFAAGTLVHTQKGCIPIEQCEVGDNIITRNRGGVKAYPIADVIQFVANSYAKIQVDEDCLCAAPDQKFYAVNKNKWLEACALQLSDQLLCANGESVCVEAITVIYEQQKIYALSIETNHTFCVGRYGIVVHNIEPTTTTTTVVVLSAVCPPAAVAVAIAEVIGLGIAGCLMYRVYKKSEKNKKKFDGCFSPQNEWNNNVVTNAKGCYSSDISVIDPVIGCGIVENPIKVVEVIPYGTVDGMDDKCIFPIAEIEQSVLCASAVENECGESRQYPGPWYNRTEDWINEHPFAQKIKKSVERSCYVNQGKRAFKMIKNIEGCDGFKKGDYVVVDAMHKDHLEVFDRYGEWKSVANFDGTRNEKKTEQGRQEPRQRLQKQG